MRKADKDAVSGLDPSVQDQAETVCKIERVMRAKVRELIPAFKKSAATQLVTSTMGEQVIKPNPEIQEIRALFKDYCAVVKVQKEILGVKATHAEITSINALRQKLKIAK